MFKHYVLRVFLAVVMVVGPVSAPFAAAQPAALSDKQVVFDFTQQPAVIIFNWFEKEFSYVVVAPPPLNNQRVTLRSVKPADLGQVVEMLTTLLVEKGFYPVLNAKQRVLEVFPLDDLNKSKLRQLLDPKVDQLKEGEEIVVARVAIEQGNAQAVRTYLNHRMKLPKWVKIEADPAQRNLEITASLTWLRQILQEVKQSNELLSTTIQGLNVRQFNLNYISARFAFQMLQDLLKLKESSEAAMAPPAVVGGQGSASADWIQGKTSKGSKPQAVGSDDQTRWPSASGMIGAVQYQIYLEGKQNAIVAVAPASVLAVIEQFLRQVDVEKIDRGQRPSLPQTSIFHVEFVRIQTAIEMLSKMFESIYGTEAKATETILEGPQSASPSDSGDTSKRGSGGASGEKGGKAADPENKAEGEVVETAGREEGLVTRTIKDRVTLIGNLSSNDIVAMAARDDLEVIEDLLKKVDVPTGQVLIDINAMEVVLTGDWQFGVGYRMMNNVFSGQQTGGVEVGVETKHLDPITKAASGVADLAANATRLGEASAVLFSTDKLNALIRLLQKETKVSVLSAPKVIAQNNRPAVIDVSDTVYYIKRSTEYNVVGTGNNPTIVPKDIKEFIVVTPPPGLVLTVTPIINRQGFVVMDIQINLSEISGAPIDPDAPPTTSKRSLKISSMVKTGQTMFLGGIVKSRDEHVVLKTPLLSDLPIIGKLFSSTTNVDSRRELVLFLTPTVVQTQTDAEELMRRQQNLHKITDWPRLEE